CARRAFRVGVVDAAGRRARQSGPPGRSWRCTSRPGGSASARARRRVARRPWRSRSAGPRDEGLRLPASAGAPARRGNPGARAVGGAAERARVAVRKAVAAAIERIDAVDPGLARLLSDTVRTGASCCYEPDPTRPTTWLTG